MYLSWQTKLFILVNLLLVNRSFVNSKTVNFRVSARQLITLEVDEDDRPDPYVKVSFRDYEKQSGYQDQTQYPRWDDVFTITYDEGTTSLVTIEVWDNDNSLNPDDRIGTVLVHPKDMGMGIERELRGTDNMWAGRIRIHVL